MLTSSRSQSASHQHYRAGIVGCGRIGCGFDDDPQRGYVSTHAGAYVHAQEVELVALADLDRTRLERYGEKFNVKGRYEDYRQMLAQEQLDILSVCTWNNTHWEIIKQAVETGVKAIFCEKPIAESLTTADAIIKCCADAGIILMVDHQRRFDWFHQEVAAYLQQGSLGTTQQVTCYYTAGIANTCSHLFDILRFFFGEVVWVQGVYSRNLSSNPQDPNVDSWLQFQSGLLCSIQACDVRCYTIFEINILGTLGRMRVMSHGFEVQFEEVRESNRFAGYQELRPATLAITPNGTPEFMLQAVSHLLDCLERGQKPICSGEDGRGALEIICALRESADADGKRVYLPLKESPIIIQSR